jgi:hypothetical protein
MYAVSRLAFPREEYTAGADSSTGGAQASPLDRVGVREPSQIERRNGTRVGRDSAHENISSQAGTSHLVYQLAGTGLLISSYRTTRRRDESLPARARAAALNITD